MTLTAGDILQSSKYVIQKCLYQSNFGVSYLASHSLLDQPVILQTLNPAVRQRSDFASVRQRFMDGVGSLSRHAQVLDSFDEDGLPMVVLQPIAGQEPLKISDWLQLPSESVAEAAVEPASQQSSQRLTLSDLIAPEENIAKPLGSPLESSSEASQTSPQIELSTLEPAESIAAGSQPPAEPLPVLSAPEISVPEISVPEVTPQTQASVAPEAAAASISKLPSLPDLPAQSSPQPSQPIAPAKRKLSTALLMTALVGLGIGTGTGLALRYQPTPQQRSSTTGAAPIFFNREQTFPSQGDWPIEEAPRLFQSTPNVEEPIYRSAPVPSYYNTPDIQPLNPLPDIPTVGSPPDVDLQPTPELNPDSVAPVEPAPKQSDLDVPPLPEPGVIDTPPDPLPPLEQMVPTLPDVPAEPPPAQSPKGLGMPPIISQ